MFQPIEIKHLASEFVSLAQIPIAPPNTLETAALAFSGPRFFVALISGVLLAFATQFVLTNLSVAAGISYLGPRPGSRSERSDRREASTMGGTIRKIGFAVGLWTLITVSIALFLACLLAVKLSLITNPGLGAIVGLVIWAAYFSLLVWVSSSTVGSFLGSLINTVTAGFQSLVSTATAALGLKTSTDQAVSTAEATASAVRRELTSVFDASSLRDAIEDYLDRLRPPDLDLSGIRREFERLLNDPELRSLAARGDLSSINRQTFVDLVSSRTDFSKRDLNRIVDQLERAWNQVVGSVKDPIAEFRDYLRSARPEALRSQELNQKLDELLAEIRQGKAGGQPSSDTQKTQIQTLMDRALQYGISTLMATVLGRTDLSHLDLNAIAQQLQRAMGQGGDMGEGAAPYTSIRADVENYLLTSYPWHFNRETIQQEFREVIYDPEADPGAIRRQLQQLNRGYFVHLLTQRGIFNPDRINEIANQLDVIRREILSTVQTAEAQEKAYDLRNRVENYLRLSNQADLTAPSIERDFRQLLEDPESDLETLRDRLSYFNRDTLAHWLNQRSDITPDEGESILNALESTRDQVLTEAQTQQTQAQSQASQLQDRIEVYLRNTGKAELNPEGIKRDLSLILQSPPAGLAAIRARLAHIDRDTFVQLLSQRSDVTPEEANQIADQVFSTWNRVVHAPQVLTGKAKEQYDNTLAAIADYLRSTHRPELDPEAIRQDLITLLHEPREGLLAVRNRLAHVDRDTLVQLLSQRPDLSEEQANQIINQVQTAVDQIVKAPRRLASRTQARVHDFQASVEAYLRNTGKEELNPEGIKRDLQLLLQDPRLGMSHMGERLSHFDRSTLVAFLAQRPDMSEAEANRVVDQILSVRDQMLEQVQNVQRQIQSVIDGVFARIRNYLNSMERPELNYEGIQRDLRTLFSDPGAGFEALRDRLSHFNRDTLVAILSSREDMSEADANRMID
ncbi:MAG: MFS transporter, partial [Leptolyngbyaceae bacterium]|nr:MFS transporter [Leptolyngbyaceae bacterium]